MPTYKSGGSLQTPGIYPDFQTFKCGPHNFKGCWETSRTSLCCAVWEERWVAEEAPPQARALRGQPLIASSLQASPTWRLETHTVKSLAITHVLETRKSPVLVRNRAERVLYTSGVKDQATLQIPQMTISTITTEGSNQKFHFYSHSHRTVYSTWVVVAYVGNQLY